MFTRDMRNYNPPIWRFKQEIGRCISISQGSGSWREYGFTTEGSCTKACISKPPLGPSLPLTLLPLATSPPKAPVLLPAPSTATSPLPPPLPEPSPLPTLPLLPVGNSDGKPLPTSPPVGNSDRKPLCDVDGLPLTEDLRFFNPPRWRYFAETEKCEELSSGSGSWKIYGFATQADCIGNCTSQSQHGENKTTKHDPICHDYRTLHLSSDETTFNPALWIFNHSIGLCQEKHYGSTSWEEYAFTNETLCYAACKKTPIPVATGSENCGWVTLRGVVWEDL